MHTEHNPSFLAWLAGFIDGEGCFSIHLLTGRGRRNFSPLLVVANTDRAALDLIAETLRCGTVHEILRSSTKVHRRRSYQYQVCGAEAIGVARLTLPYLRIKGQQAALFLAFPSTRQGKRVPDEVNQERARIHEALKELHL